MPRIVFESDRDDGQGDSEFVEIADRVGNLLREYGYAGLELHVEEMDRKRDYTRWVDDTR